MPVHADENLLNQVFRAFTITDDAVYKIQLSRLIPVHQHVKTAAFAGEEGIYQIRVVKLAKLAEPASFRGAAGWCTERCTKRGHRTLHSAESLFPTIGGCIRRAEQNARGLWR